MPTISVFACQLQLDHRSGVASPEADLGHPGVTARAIRELRNYNVEKSLNEIFIVQRFTRHSASMQVISLRVGYDFLGYAPDLFGSRFGGLDFVVHQQRAQKALKQSHPLIAR
jgi:hypothetical protein